MIMNSESPYHKSKCQMGFCVKVTQIDKTLLILKISLSLYALLDMHCMRKNRMFVVVL